MSRTKCRGKWWCSYKRTTLIVGAINIGVALYVLHSSYNSLYIYPYTGTQNDAKYTPDQIKKMEESIRIRKAAEPLELLNVVKRIPKKILKEENVAELRQSLKQTITDEILERLRHLNASTNITQQRDGIESWRMKKLKEAQNLVVGKALTSTIPLEEAGKLVRALESNWAELSEEIGLWIPVEIINTEHNDKPEGLEEFDEEVLPGKKLPEECHTELHTDYAGAAVRWGLTHHKDSAYDCCMDCLEKAKRAKPGEMKCNIWVYCPSETGCYSPDIYQHKNGECWLKYAERPKHNFKDKYSESYRRSHPKAPLIVPWASGVVSV